MPDRPDFNPISTPNYPDRDLDQFLAIPEPVSAVEEIAIRRFGIRIKKIALFFISLYLFIYAISLMKAGARGLTPYFAQFFANLNPSNSLGFGWLSAYIIMSGSPVAAAALTIFDAGALDNVSTYAMITGSRLGASFIVLFIGFLYVLRGRDRATSLSVGLLSLTVTATTYIPGLFLGLLFLNLGLFDRFQLQSGVLLQSIIEWGIQPLTTLAVGLFPNWLVFLLGLGIIMISFNLFDKCLPQMTLKESQIGWMSRLVYKPGVMFALGALVTFISMSVSLSLSLLVPLSNRGFVRRENVIPYILGANITTFIDTLLAAVLLNNPVAFTIVLIEMVSVLIISIIILITVYEQYQAFMLKFVTWVTRSNRNLVIFMIGILVIPILLLII